MNITNLSKHERFIIIYNMVRIFR